MLEIRIKIRINLWLIHVFNIYDMLIIYFLHYGMLHRTCGYDVGRMVNLAHEAMNLPLNWMQRDTRSPGGD